MNSLINSNWHFAVINNRLTFVSFHIVFLSFCRSWENVTPGPGSGIQNSAPAPAPASEKPPELRQNSGSGNSVAQHYFLESKDKFIYQSKVQNGLWYTQTQVPVPN
jgi:hypothetical protein